MTTEGSKREEKLEKGLAREGPGRGSAKEGPRRGWAQGREAGLGWAAKGGPRKGGWARKGKGPKRRAGLGGEGAKDWESGWGGQKEWQGSGKGAGGNIMGIQRDPLFEGAYIHSLFLFTYFIYIL